MITFSENVSQQNFKTTKLFIVATGFSLCFVCFLTAKMGFYFTFTPTLKSVFAPLLCKKSAMSLSATCSYLIVGCVEDEDTGAHVVFQP